MSTFQEICEQVAPKIGVDQTLFASVIGGTAQEQIDILEIARDSVEALTEAHDWQVLKSVATINTGDGATEAFNLPSDYGRMPATANLRSSRLIGPYQHIVDEDEWLEIDIRDYEQVTGVWTLIGGQINIKPAPESTETIKYYYQSNAVVDPVSGSNKAFFTVDTDTIRIPEKLLRLDMIWRWKASKGTPYEEDLENFNIAFEHRKAADKGARIIAVGRTRLPRGAKYAWPRTISS